MRNAACVGLLALAVLAFSGCGYHTAGHAVTLPSNIQTIAIPAFVNQTQTYQIEQKLTAAVVRELVTRTRYHILNQASDDADEQAKKQRHRRLIGAGFGRRRVRTSRRSRGRR